MVSVVAGWLAAGAFDAGAVDAGAVELGALDAVSDGAGAASASIMCCGRGLAGGTAVEQAAVATTRRSPSEPDRTFMTRHTLTRRTFCAPWGMPDVSSASLARGE